MKKRLKSLAERNRESMALGEDLTKTLSAFLLTAYYDREPTAADRRVGRMWGKDLASIQRLNLPAEEIAEIDEHHGEMMCILSDQAFIAGLFAGLKMTALRK